MHIGVDTGGTFTDLVVFDPATGQLDTHKVSSTPDNPALAVLQGIQDLLQKHQQPTEKVQYLVHGTTVATNAVLQSRWEKSALITTEGFRDVLEIGRQNRPELYNFFTVKPEPLVARHLRLEVAERLDYQGNVIRELDEASVHQLAESLIESDVDSVAIVFLFSYLNPEHERKVRALLQEKIDIPIILSSETLPEFREYERTSTTVLNAALVPVVDRYLQALDEETKNLGIQKDWRIMQSNAGITSAAFARTMPVTLLLSGPAGGVEGSRFVGQQTGHLNLITLDMGGTSCDVSLIHQGQPKLTSEGQIADRPLRVPMVDMETIGAGGGSLAWIDAGGALRVGPQSAGAQPGPVCYGRGGTQPAVTDAQLALGRLNPETALGDIPRLDIEASKAAIETHIAKPLGMSLEEAASGILAVADAHMERAIRLISIERGHDPRQFALLGFGGAGPLHSEALAKRLNIPTVIIPNSAGVLSAFGLLTADLVHTLVQTVLQKQDTVDWHQVNDIYQNFKAEAQQRLVSDGIEPENMMFQPSMDVRYQGQSFEINAEVPDQPLNEKDFAGVAENFHEAHQMLYGYADEGEPLEVVNLRLKAVGPMDKPNFPEQQTDQAEPNWIAKRQVYFEETGWVDCPCYERESILHPMTFSGPAILEGKESTVVIYPNRVVKADPYGHLIVEDA